MLTAVRFHPRFEILAGKPNTLGLVGAGSVELADGALLVRHKKARWFRFSKEETLSFPLEGVVNVQRGDKDVAFQVRGGADSIRVWFESAASAERLAAALPAQRTPEFARQVEDAQAFAARLEALGTRARVTQVLAALNVSAFVAMAALGAGVMVPDVEVATRFGTNFGPLTMNGEWWRLAASMVIHFGLVHLLLNTWALWSGGHLIERLYGSVPFLAVYVFSGLAGSLASLAWNPLVNSAGASGAIFGLYGALLAFFVRGRLGIPKAIARSQAASALSFIGYSLVYGFAHQGIDNAAHIGGLVMGFAMGALLAQPMDAQVRRERGAGHLARAGAAGLALAFAVAWPVTHPGDAVRQDQAFLRDLDRINAQEGELHAEFNRLVDGAKAGTVSDPDFLKGLSIVIARWSELQRRVAQDQVAPGSPLEDYYAFVARYLQLHGEALQLTHDAVAKDDSSLMDRANAKGRERDELVAERQRALGARR